MIRFSAILVAGAIAVLVAGVLATSLALVYLSIGVSIVALVLLAVGVILRRKEIFGGADAAAATGQPAWPVTPATGTPAMVGGRARIPEPGARPAEAGGPRAEAGAGSGNGNSGPPAERDVAAEIRWAWQEQEGFPEAGPARAPQGRNGPGRNGPGQDGPAADGPSRAGRVGGYSGTHSSGRGRPPTAPPGRRPSAVPSAGTSPRGAEEPAANGSAYSGTDPGQGTRPGQDTRPGQRAAGTAPPGRSAGPPGPLAGAGPPAWPDPDISWQQEPTGTRRPSREPDAGWVFTPPTLPPDLPASPAEEPDALAPAAEGPDAPAPAAEAPDAGVTQQEAAHDRWPSHETEDRAATPPTPPERPRSPAERDQPALPGDDFWDRVNEELVTGADREPDSPPRAAPAGPPPPAAGGDLWSRPVDRRADEAVGHPGPGRSAASEQWSAWAPSVSRRPGSPSAGGKDEPPDRADERAAGQGAEAGTLGPLFAWRDAAADDASAAGREAADAEKEADVKAEEADEEEEAAPSPWSIPLTLVGDLSDLGEEDDGQPAGPGTAEDHGTGKPLAAGGKPPPERTGSDVWARPSWTRAEEKQAGSAETAFAGRGPWLTRPGKDTAPGSDPGDAAATRADDKAGADDDAKATPSDRDDVPDRTAGRDDAATRAGRDDAATRAGRDDADVPAGRDDADVRAGRDRGGADDRAEATRAGRDTGDGATEGRTVGSAGSDAGALPTRAGRDGAATRAGGEAGADDHAKATPAGRDAGAAAGTSMASAGSASTSAEAGQLAPGEAKPPSATPAGRPSTTLFQPTIRPVPGTPPDPVMGKTAGPGTQREAPSAAGGAGGQRAPEAGSGTVAGQPGPASAAARDDDQRSATGQSGAERSGPAPAPDGNAFVIVPGVARYHRTGCILIRFLGGDNLETATAQEAEAKGCAPCRACEPDKPLSSGD